MIDFPIIPAERVEFFYRADSKLTNRMRHVHFYPSSSESKYVINIVLILDFSNHNFFGRGQLHGLTIMFS